MTTLAFESAVSELVAKGFARTAAEQAVREQLQLAPAFQANGDRDANALEKAEQVEIRKLFIAYGFEIYNLSQARASKQTPGIFDLQCFHTRLPLSFWYDSKRQIGARLSPAQERFHDHCWRTGVRAYYGDRYRAVELLLELELAVRGAGAYGIEPIRLALPTGERS